MVTLARWAWRRIRRLARRPGHWAARLVVMIVAVGVVAALLVRAWPLFLALTVAWGLAALLVSRLHLVGTTAVLVLLLAAEIAVRVLGGGPGAELAPAAGVVAGISDHRGQAFSRRQKRLDPLDVPDQGGQP